MTNLFSCRVCSAPMGEAPPAHGMCRGCAVIAFKVPPQDRAAARASMGMAHLPLTDAEKNWEYARTRIRAYATIHNPRT